MSTGIVANKAKRKLAAGELTLCMAISQMRSPDVAMIAAACGFDAIFVDLEHSPMSLESASGICVAALLAGVTPIARVSSRQAIDATRILDAGAQGVMVPHIDTVEQAQAIVQACKYPPLGHRSAFGIGPTLGYQAAPQATVNEQLNNEVLLMAMVETPQAVENADAIAAIPGIDALHMGSLDLSNAMGIPAAYRDPRMWRQFEMVAAACKRHGKAMGVGGARGDVQLQADLIALGARYLTTGSDVSYLMAAARSDVAQLRALGA